jgi:phosphoserine phosphatase RsbU/P
MREKILIVDDSIANRKLLSAILKKEGYELLEAEDGEQAIEFASRELPDLILLDIMMPKIDGYQVCETLKGNEQTFTIPIIFLSAMTEEKDKIKGLDLGAADYVTKPFNKGEVLARVRAQLKIRSLTQSLLKANHELEEKQRSLEEDLKAAGLIQQSLLPTQECFIDHAETAWKFMPCQKVGGDLFNFYQLDQDHWAIYIFDVSGHGVPSAMVAVSVSQMLRPEVGLTLRRSADPKNCEIVSPSQVLARLDREYPMERFDKYFTLAYFILNAKNGNLLYSNAAHPPPIVLRSNGGFEALERGGTIVGLGGLLPFEEGVITLAPGDKLFLYTDGITEYENLSGKMFGQDGLLSELQRMRDRPITEMVDSVLARIVEFGGGNDPQDDVTLLGLEYKGC